MSIRVSKLIVGILSLALACHRSEIRLDGSETVTEQMPPPAVRTANFKTIVTHSPNRRFTIYKNIESEKKNVRQQLCFAEGGEVVWCKELHYSLDKEMVTDSGHVIGYGSRPMKSTLVDTSSVFVFSIINRYGVEMLQERQFVARTGSYFPPVPDYPVVVRIVADEESDLVMLWTSEDPDRMMHDAAETFFGVSKLHVYRMSTGAGIDTMDLSSFGVLGDAVLVSGVPFVATITERYDAATANTFWSLIVVDLQKGPIWSRKLTEKPANFSESNGSTSMIEYERRDNEEPIRWLRSIRCGEFQIRSKNDSVRTFDVRCNDSSWIVDEAA